VSLVAPVTLLLHLLSCQPQPHNLHIRRPQNARTLLEAAVVAPAAKWAPPATRAGAPASPAAAAELEVLRAQALDRLRARLAASCREAGLQKAPLLAFERWRFAAKLAEDAGPDAAGPAAKDAAAPAGEQQQQQKKQKPNQQQPKRRGALDPVLPSAGGAAKPAAAAAAAAAAPATQPTAATAGLIADLTKVGMAVPAAAAAAEQLSAASATAAAAVAKRAQQLASGAAPDARLAAVAAAFHRHSVDLAAGGERVMVTREAYGKLIRLFREHCAADEAPPPAPAAAAAAAVAVGAAAAAAAGGGDKGSAASASVAAAAAAEAADAEAAAAAAEDAAGAAVRAAFHARLFALLLRYKSLQGHGFQAAIGPPVFRLLRRALGVGYECFASPLNASFSGCASAFPDVDGPFGSSGSFFK
jgi:phosphorylated CTD-interacting factor 1